MVKYYSHIGQDRWVAEVYNYKRGGYFLDFGALDGILTSNTYTFEKEFGWTGIIVEANPTSYPDVCRNRTSIAVNAALWSTSREKLEMLDAHGLSSAVQHQDSDSQGDLRRSITKRRFSIDTINPTELLERHCAPELIEYLSLDVEGAEMEVLQSFDFKRFRPGLMTIEHSEVPEKQSELRKLLKPLGYKVTQRHYDDWYWHPEIVAALGGGGDAEKQPLRIAKEIGKTFVIVNA